MAGPKKISLKDKDVLDREYDEDAESDEDGEVEDPELEKFA
jgi:hypothetical protein